ncbi:IS3 family transposase [Paenibacillus alvei]|uniref:IS3 family transposase n=1 Tax=Paenibacillus alvei TaxID=44250 RepID=UPI002280249C|nr:IS3 family transposase [Paenibacillus alvei]MCY9579727.1 IS3 family transposase [Paenibacillus alvei]
MAQATQEHKTCVNLLKRQFDQAEPEIVLLTDITYFKYNHGQQWGYLSCVKDGSTYEISAHYLSTSLEQSLVNRTLDKLLERLDGNIYPEAILHFYNTERYQWTLKKMTPNEYRNHLLVA